MPDGSAEPVHSHNFCATAELSAENLDDKAMVTDFCSLKETLDKITDNIAKSGNIGRIDYFAKKGQTTEVMAQYIFERLRKSLSGEICLLRVIVTEEPGCRASYSQ